MRHSTTAVPSAAQGGARYDSQTATQSSKQSPTASQNCSHSGRESPDVFGSLDDSVPPERPVPPPPEGSSSSSLHPPAQSVQARKSQPNGLGSSLLTFVQVAARRQIGSRPFIPRTPGRTWARSP